MAMSAEDTARLMTLRGKALRGEATIEELKEGLQILRAGRVAAQTASTKSRTTKAAANAPVDTASVLAGLKGLADKLSTGPVA